MSLTTASRRVEESGHSLTVGVLRGLYDPVLDDSEPLYYEPEDLGLQSEPTEVVFQIQNFVEPSDIGSHDLDPRSELESRSLTSSPFVTPTKPYRPFSTEPLPEIPPLEDPIILNPDYRDTFGRTPCDNDPEYLLNSFGNVLGESRYKLPISDQYDPDGTRFKQNTEVVEKLLKYEKHVKSLSKDLEVVDVTKETRVCEAGVNVLKETKAVVVNGSAFEDVRRKSVRIEEGISEGKVRIESKTVEKKEMSREEIEEESLREELKYIEKMKQEIDVQKIEETAMQVVDDSIERAVSVAEEIKKEIDVELLSSEKSEQVTSETEKKDISKYEMTEQSSEVVDKTETSEYAERKMSKEERIVNEEENSRKMSRKDFKETESSETISTEDSKMDVHRKSVISEEYQQEYIEEPRRKESSVQESSESKAKFKKIAKTVASGVKSEKNTAEQRAYTIGLQTIPNIRGTVHSSYHYNLLLQTFFIHLTDVMVALSRFLLSQPIFNQLDQSYTEKRSYESAGVQKTSQVQKTEEARVVQKTQDRRQLVTPVPVVEKKEVKSVTQKFEKDVKMESQEKKVEKREIIKPVPVKEVKQEVKVEKKEVKQEEKIEKVATGVEMAQRSEKKLTQEMTQKMDAVISEFQTIAVEEDKKEMFQKSRRSRSRSQIEEEVMKESDPLEWLSKVDSKRTSQERTEISKKEFSSTEAKKSVIETKEERTSRRSKSPRQTYIAIVESHVYTNKDAIFEEHVTDFSETSSVQSAEEVNTAIEAIETISTENVAIESALRELETAKVVEETRELATVTAKSAATVQKIEEVVHDTKEFVHEEFERKSAVQKTDVQEVIVQEIKEIIEPVVEIKERVETVEKASVDINESLSVAQSTEVSVMETKSEFVAAEVKKEEVKIEEVTFNEKVVEIEPEIHEPKPVETVEITETVKLKPNKEKTEHDEYAALKIVKIVPVDSVLSPEIIEVEDISELIARSTVSTVGVGDAVSVDATKEISESSSISTHIGKSEKKESLVDISEIKEKSISKSALKEEKTSTQEISQEASFTAKSVDRKLSLKTDLQKQLSSSSLSSPPSTIDTPTPSTVPPTPLTDEYVFKLSLPLPKSRSATPVPRDCTPEDEDPHIVKKNLVPHIETTIEQVVYDQPLPTPIEEPKSPVFTKPVLNGGGKVYPVYSKPGLKGGSGRIRFPVYRKPGLYGGGDNPDFSKEEIREIERKSSLLASAIDETIKSIEEYKEEVGIETKKEVKKEVNIQEHKEEKITKSYQESYTSEEIIKNGFNEIDTKIEEMIEQCNTMSIDTKADSSNHENEGIVTEIDETRTRRISIEIEPQNQENNKDQSIKVDIVEIETHIQDNKGQNGIADTGVIEPSSVIVKERETTTVDAIKEDITPVVEKTEIREEFKPEFAAVEVKTESQELVEEKFDPLTRVRPVVFDPENIQRRGQDFIPIQEPMGISEPRQSPYINESGELMGTIQGIVDGLEEPVMDPELAKELGKPGISEEKIATLISGEAEMLREAHVMGLSRVLSSHMHRADDDSVDFQKIKPMINSLKDSEVLKALNEELERKRQEEKKKEEKKWTTFLQKPKRPVPKAKFGYPGWTEDTQIVAEPYKVKIVKQAKPKVAPDYKPEDFETGPLPWEERAATESSLPPVEPEEPILIPEVPEFLEAVDPLKESEVPDLEETGIPLPPPKEPTPPPAIEEKQPEPEPIPEVPEEEPEVVPEAKEQREETREDMENRMAQQLVKSVQGMVDPNASLDQQLAQMRAQLAALAQLPEVIQQSLEMVSKQLTKISHQEVHMEVSQTEQQSYEQVEATQNHEMQTIQEVNENSVEVQNEEEKKEQEVVEKMTIEEVVNQENEQRIQQEQQNNARMTPVMTEEEIRNEKQRKEQARIEHESRLVKQHPTPRASKPKRVFGPPDPDQMLAVVLPGGRRWRNTQDVYDEQKIKEMFEAQSEVIKGNAIGFENKFESDLLPYDNRINFMKYEKPPVSLDHLKHSEVYKLVHDMDETPLKRVEMRTPVICEADYRERCRSMTPSAEKKHLQIPQQFHP
ncbi:titin [Spodoptera frugiperda]|uniref:Titin n=1 Tax=Spodoptera frugiperda TaxID=7108 RepID=A0A9R0DZQ1_SPOFR|nr:titin [Spodoptera frugiperda]